MHEFLAHAAIVISAYGALGFFIGGFLEEILSPIPSPLILVGVAAYLNRSLSLSLFASAYMHVLIPITLGATAGSLVIYIIAYKGGEQAVRKMRGRLGFSWQDVEKLQKKLRRKSFDEVLVFIARAMPLVPSIISNAGAGIIRMNAWVFALLTAVGVLIRVSLLFAFWVIFGHAILS